MRSSVSAELRPVSDEYGISEVFASVRNPESSQGNLGDRMGHLLARHFRGDTVELFGVEHRQRITGRTALLVGSILESIQPLQAPAVLGPGFIKLESNASRLKSAQLLGVRGELTAGKIRRELGVRVPVVGDPGLLLPDLLGQSHQGTSDTAGESGVAKTVGFVIHSVDRADFRVLEASGLLPKGTQFVDNYAELEKFAEQMQRCDCIFSSSLHGVIFAHALGKKAVPLNSLSGDVTGGGYKFEDYFSAFGFSPRMVSLPIVGSKGTPVSASELNELCAVFPQPKPRDVALLQANLRAEINKLLEVLL